MPSHRNRANNNQASKEDNKTKINVALIGLVATLGAALITSLFGITQKLIEIYEPIKAKQTEEAQPAISNFFLTKTPGAPFTFPTGSADTLDWNKVLTVSTRWKGCGNPNVLPKDVLFDRNDAVKSYDTYMRTFGSSPDWSLWSALPSQKEGFSLSSQITSLGKNPQWIRLDSHISIHITVEAPPNHLDAVLPAEGCGEGRATRKFPPVTLLNSNPGLAQYSLQVKNSDYDYFSLEPGEFEVFDFKFTCQSPGIYSIKFAIPFSDGVETGQIVFSSPPKLVCPNSFSIWSVDTTQKMITYQNTFKWNGEKYMVSQ